MLTEKHNLNSNKVKASTLSRSGFPKFYGVIWNDQIRHERVQSFRLCSANSILSNYIAYATNSGLKQQTHIFQKSLETFNSHFRFDSQRHDQFQSL